MFTLTFCLVCFVQISCSENATVLGVAGLWPPAVKLLSVPGGQSLCLPCGGPDRSDIVWTLQDKKVLVTRRGTHETNQDEGRLRLLSNGGLCLLQLVEADGGEYRCNQQLVAELQVLKGRDFTVPAGRTLLLSCSSSSKPRQRWFHRWGGRQWKAIFTRFRNGSVKAETDESGLSFENGTLQIQDLQPGGAGEYMCNGELQARVSVLAGSSERPQLSGFFSSIGTTGTPAAMATDAVKRKKKRKGRENVLLLVTASGFGGVMILLVVVLCVFLSGVVCRTRRYQRKAAQTPDDTELQPWKTCSSSTGGEPPENPEETIHYASLGRHNWTERVGSKPAGRTQHSVIYSSVIGATRNQ